MSEVLKNSIVLTIEMHAVFLAIILLLYRRMLKTYLRTHQKFNHALSGVYVGCTLMIASDCLWTCVSSTGTPNNIIAYIINLVYFFGSSYAAICWFVFCLLHLEDKIANKKSLRIIALIVYNFLLLFYALSPWFGFIFTIKNGVYIRGNLYFLDPALKLSYVVGASLLAILSGRKKDLNYLRKKDFDLALFGIPPIVCGVLQVITGVDFNCLGFVAGLLFVYITGITNSDRENTDAIYSLANSFETTYIVNMDTGAMRPLHQEALHDAALPGLTSMNYTTHFNKILPAIVLPEDLENTLKTFDMQNIKDRFEIDHTFNIRYRVCEPSRQTEIHTATFIQARGENGKEEFLLGINAIQTDSLIYERNEALLHENQRLEQINTNIIESVAKIVEARDGGTGDHIVRVRKLTNLIAQEIMADYPKYKLDEEQVKLISSASVLHDVGKISIPDAVLLSESRLTDEEFEIMKTHTVKGCDILNLFPLGLDDAFLEYALCICRWHHEKYDGKGYPDGLKGDDIPIAAQIVSAADCFDALVSDRPYKKAFTPEKALEMLANGECGAFSPEILHALEMQRDSLISLAKSNK